VILPFCSWQLKGFEFIRGVHFDPEPFDLERDLITPTYKKKRPQLLKYYQVAHPIILSNLIDVYVPITIKKFFLMRSLFIFLIFFFLLTIEDLCCETTELMSLLHRK
jgi:hypothetical protein